MFMHTDLTHFQAACGIFVALERQKFLNDAVPAYTQFVPQFILVS